jgi:hypothetical protein
MQINLHNLRRVLSTRNEAHRLAVLAAAYEHNDHPVYEVLEEHRRIAKCAEGGRVALVWSGMDCDGSRYSGSVHLVAAAPKAVQAAVAHELEWADGPCSYYIERPSIAMTIPRESRDLGLEAFEDGHPHVIYG